MTTTTIKKDTLTAVSTISGAIADYNAAKAAYSRAKAQAVKALGEVVDTLPDDTAILNKDIAALAGISPLHMANIVNAGCDRRIANTTINVTRRFIEIDENGQPIEGAKVKETHTELLGYRRNTARW